MTQAMQLTVDRNAFTEARADPLPRRPLADGEALLTIDQFAITSNNVTYAAIGTAFGYWDFFPVADAARGIVPVWGHATVAESRAEGLRVGERVYGYLPMASQLIVTPVAVTPGSFTDGAPHRAARAAVYNQYRRLDADPGHVAGGEDVRAVFEPLFLTSMLIEAMFRRANWNGARRLIVTSASSKTALALAHVARAASPDVERVGLTSARNLGFVERTGLYNRVLGYDELGELGAEQSRGGASVSVDFAGNGALLAQLHQTLADDLVYSCLVGMTDWTHRGGFSGHDLPGAKPILFFAPDHVATTIGELGAKGFQTAVADRWRAFASDAAALIRIDEVAGLEAAVAAWGEAARGEVAADRGVVVRV